MATILLTGAKGQLGREIVNWHWHDPIPGRNKLIATDVGDLDITNYPKLCESAGNSGIGIIINCAAYTAVDKAESDEESARRINAFGAESLARLARAYDAALLHISTDYVFDGKKDKPYREDDPASPATVYGRTKLEGEQAVQRLAGRSMIIRTSWLYSSHGSNFVNTMIRLGREKGEVGVVDDQWGTPTYAADLADFIMRCAVPRLLASKSMSELYHYSGMGSTTWCGFARKIMTLAGIDCRVDPLSTDGFPTPARRPHYSVLDKSKVIADFNINIPSWEDSLEKCIKKIEGQ